MVAKFLRSDGLFWFISICKLGSYKNLFATITSLSEFCFRFRRFILFVKTKKVISINYDNSTSSWVILMKKSWARIWKKKFFQLSNLSQSVFLLENPTHWGLETAVCPIFAKPVLDIFAVCSVVPICTSCNRAIYAKKNKNYLLEKADLRFFLNYGLRTTIKITIFSTFYVTDNFSSCYSRNSCKKIQTLSIKLSSK